MKTKKQKEEQIKRGSDDLKKNQTIIVTDFTGLGVNNMNSLRKNLRTIEASMSVIKKRLLKIIIEKEGMEFDAKQFEGQAGVIFSPKDIVESSGLVYEFSKQHRDKFNILGGYEISEKKFLSGDEIRTLGQLPSREVLLTQLVGMLASPIRSFLFVLNEKAKQTTN